MYRLYLKFFLVIMYCRIVKETVIEIKLIDCNLRFSIRKGDQKLFFNRKGEFTKKYLSKIDTKANINEEKKP